MKVKDYEYEDYNELDEAEELTEERKEKLIQKVKDQIIRENIALHKILEIGENYAEYHFIYEWLNQNHIQLSGINGSISGELENYKYIPKMGQSYTPDILEEQEQEKLFYQLDELKQQQVDKNSKQYQEIRNKLIEHNMRLAKWVASWKSLNNSHIEKEDLQQMAMETLIKAVDSFDISAGNKFSSYAVPAIYYRVKNAIRDTLKMNENRRAEWQRLEQLEDEMLKTFNRKPTDTEIKEFLGISDNGLKDLKRYIAFQLQESLEHLQEEDEDAILNELLDDEKIIELDRKPIVNGTYLEDSVLDIEDVTGQTDPTEATALLLKIKADIQTNLATLTPREKRILELRYGLKDAKEITLKEVRRKKQPFKRKNSPDRSKSIKKIKASNKKKGTPERLFGF